MSQLTNYSTENYDSVDNNNYNIINNNKDEPIYQSSCMIPNHTSMNNNDGGGGDATTTTTYLAATPANFSLEELENINKNIIIENGNDTFNPSSLAYSLETFSSNEDIYLMLQQYHQNNNVTNEQPPAMIECDLQGQQILINKMNEGIIPPSIEIPKITSRKKDGSGAKSSNRNVRDERRRSSHNEVERKRRGKINALITQLNQLVPESFGVDDNTGSKGKVLSRIHDYMFDLTEQHKHFEHIYQENIALKRELEILQYHHQHCTYTNNNNNNNSGSCDLSSSSSAAAAVAANVCQRQTSGFSDLTNNNRNPSQL